MPSVQDISEARTLGFFKVHGLLLGLTCAILAGLLGAGLLSPETIGSVAWVVGGTAVAMAASWVSWRLGASPDGAIVGLLLVDSVVMLTLFYQAGEFETPALSLLSLALVMTPLYTRRRGAVWLIAGVQIAMYGALLWLRGHGGVPGLAYRYRIPEDALADPELLVLSFGAFTTFTLGMAFLVGRASVDILQSSEQLREAVRHRTFELDVAKAELEQRNTELRQANDTLQDSNEALEHFNAAVAHDLRSPLQGISTAAQLIGLGTDDHEVLTEQIGERVQRVERMLAGLLRLARVRGRNPEVVRVQLAEALAEALSNLESEPRRDSASVEVRTIGGACAGDPPLVTELMQNLLQNALRYGTEPRLLIQELPPEAGCVRIAVEDDGPGVPESERQLIFEAFRRASSRGPEGTGTGLAIVRRIVSAHGGTVHVTTGEELGGASFVVALPAS